MNSLLMLRTARRAAPAAFARRAAPRVHRCLVARLSTKDEGEAKAAPAEAPAEEAAEQPEGESPLALALKERDEFKSKWMRALAETENVRTIARRDVNNAKDFAVQSFAKSLFDVSDSLTFALKACEDTPDAASNVIVEGITMTRGALVKAFGSNGLKEFAAIGDKFDTKLHEVLFEYDDETKEEKTIGQIMKSGFILNGRVLRAAQVGVVKARPAPAAAPAE
ncbi:GrpE-domain-containing protein [Pelagophyceae sp. CCMP2097]|nr:GrpE-domain-containing protein [Pelagophyceae sp. CCMP2097]